MLKIVMIQLFLDTMLKNPERYGVIEFDSKIKIISIEEKTKQAKIKICYCWLIFL